MHLENDLVVSGKDRLGEGSVRGLGMDTERLLTKLFILFLFSFAY